MHFGLKTSSMLLVGTNGLRPRYRVQKPRCGPFWLVVQSRLHGCYTSAHGPCCRFAIAASNSKTMSLGKSEFAAYRGQIAAHPLRERLLVLKGSSIYHSAHEYQYACLNVRMHVCKHACV